MKYHHGPGDCCGGFHHGMHGDGPGRGHGGGWRRFMAPEEERELIEHYISELEKELAGAKTRLAEIVGK